MYCVKCGTQNTDGAHFCVKCGNNLGSNKPEIERKGITVTLGKKGVLGFRSGKKWKMVIAIFVYFWLFLILTAMLTPSPKTYISSIDILPNLQDMPPGTRLGSEGLDVNHSERVFMVNGLQYVHYKVTIYPTIEDAKSKFIMVKDKAKTMVSIEDVRFGDEAFIYRPSLFQETMIIRKNNIGITMDSDTGIISFYLKFLKI